MARVLTCICLTKVLKTFRTISIMEQIKLIGFGQQEIPCVSGKGISFKKIRIANEDCSSFNIIYEIFNLIDQSTFRSPISCLTSPYQRDLSQVILYKSIIIPENCTFKVQLQSANKPSFLGTAIIDYETFTPEQEKIIAQGSSVFISEKDKENAFRIALKTLGRFFNIPDWEYDDNLNLYNKIRNINSPIFPLLQSYFKAYDEWFKFYERIKLIETKEGQSHALTSQEKNELGNLINNRENALNLLQEKFDELQFQRFKESTGLGNIDGIKS